MEWYRWRPGAIPQLERVSLAVRGAAQAVMDAYWIRPELMEWAIGPLFEHLMIDLGESDRVAFERILGPIRMYVEDERSTGEAFRQKKREAGRLGGLARQAMLGSASSTPSSASSMQAQTDIPTYKQTKTTPPRGKPRSKPAAPPEPSLEEILGGKGSKNWERYWKLAQLWPSEKNPAPKRSARAFLKAMEQMQGKEPAVYWAAQAYREKHEDPTGRDDRTRFMKLFETWLAEEGWQAEREVMREAERAV